MTSIVRIASLLLLPAVLVTPDAAGQMFTYDREGARPVQSLALTYTMVDFNYDGEGTPETSFEFEAPVYGITYLRPNVVATLAYGADDSARDLRLLDAAITTWGEFRIAGSRGGRLYVPIALHTNYRRVAPKGEEDSLVDAFNITVLGLGTGLGYHQRIGDALIVHLQVLPVIGLALRAFGDSAGSARLVNAGIQLHSPRIIGRFGLSAGYAFRAQVWNVSASNLVPQGSDDFFDYAGSQHSLMIGINW